MGGKRIVLFVYSTHGRPCHHDRYAYRKGLFVIRQWGDSVELANDHSFQPRAW